MSPTTSVAARIEGGRAPVDLQAVQTRDELRGTLLDDLIAGRAVWIGMGGLAFGGVGEHARLLRAARQFRAGPAGLSGTPHTAVFDWSTVRGPADVTVLAGAPTLEAAVVRTGALFVSCEPRDPVLAAQLTAGGLAGYGGRWVGEPNGADRLPHVSLSRLRRSAPLLAFPDARAAANRVARAVVEAPILQLLGPVAVIAPGAGHAAADAVGTFAAAVEREVARYYLADDYPGLVGAVVGEFAANAIRRAAATRVALVAGVRRAGIHGDPWLEIAVADDGVGIAATAREVRGVVVRELVPERYFVADLFHGVHDPMPSGVGGLGRRRGRGMIGVLHLLFDACPARLTVRTGGVLVAVDRSGLRLAVVGPASTGLWTVARLAVPLCRGSGGVGARGHAQ